MIEDPLVSILCFTYNHAKYIDDAMQGFLNQKTDFDYEILVHDDVSTDGTIEILKKYQEDYPNIVHVFFEETNQFSLGNHILYGDICNNIRGKYVAFCEGDDYWVDNNKLQIQVDYMQKHPDVVMTAHNCLILDCRSGKLVGMNGFPGEQDVTMEDILLHKNNCFQTASYVMRRDIYFVPDYYRECQVWDWPCQIYAATKGKVHYFDRISHIYRYVSSENSWTNKTFGKDYKKTVNYLTHIATLTRFFERLNREQNFQYDDKIDPIVNGFYQSAASLILDNDFENFDELRNDVIKNTRIDIFQQWDKIMSVLSDVKKIRSDIINFVKKHDNIYIYGTGPLSDNLVDFLEMNKIDIDGYVVSDGQPINGEKRNKPVYFISDVANSAGNYGLVISVRNVLKNEIESILQKTKINNYIWSWM